MENNTWGKAVVEKALLYAEHKWYPTDKNVMHGVDENGRYVDTPDITWKGELLNCGWWKPNEKNKGVAYGWGNASSIEEFDQGIADGKYAGNVPEDTSRYGSWNTVGVDCSGLLTVCWGLPKKIAARDIPNIAKVIDISEIRQGDDDDKIRLNQRKPSKYKGLSRFGPEKNLQRINKFMKERPTFYKKLIQMKENFRFYLRCFYCITKVVILQFNSEKQDRISS